MKTIKVKCTLIEEALGLNAADPEIHAKFVELKKAKIAKAEADMAKNLAKEHEEIVRMAEERKKLQNTVDSKQVDMTENGLSVFFIDQETGKPYFTKAQIRGYIKDKFTILKELKQGSFATFKRMPKTVVNRQVFVGPDKILIDLPEGQTMGECTRPIRIEKFPQDITSIKTSDTVPAGSVLRFSIGILDDDLYDNVIEALEYGALHGFGQWRNAGKGRFHFAIWDDKKCKWIDHESKVEQKLGLDAELPA